MSEKTASTVRHGPAATDRSLRPSLWLKCLGARKTIVAIVVTVAILAVGLGVGLGVGLKRGRDSGGGVDDSGSGIPGTGNSPDTAPNRTSLWTPDVGAAWQIVLKKPLKLDGGSKGTSKRDGSGKASLPLDSAGVKIYDVDVFDNDQATIAALQAAGARVICYFSAGSQEDWRADKDAFADADLGKPLDGWRGERWVNVSSAGVRAIMARRIRLVASKGCDAIGPDNVDGYVSGWLGEATATANPRPTGTAKQNGLGLTAGQAADFVRFLARTAAAYNMTTGLKNAGSLVGEVLDEVAFSVNEECVKYGECAKFAAFVRAGKPVHIEYPDGAGPDMSAATADATCAAAADAGRFSTVIKKIGLDGWVRYCDGTTFDTQTA